MPEFLTSEDYLARRLGYSGLLCCGTCWQRLAVASPRKHFSEPIPEVGMKNYVVIDDWDGDAAIRLPEEALQTMGVEVGDVLYLLEQYIGTSRCLVLSKTPELPDRVDELVGHWESFAKSAAEINAKDE